jgi:hypothetical protein
MALEWTCTYAQDLWEHPVEQCDRTVPAHVRPYVNPRNLSLHVPRGPVLWTGEIFLKTLTGKTITLNVESNYTVYQIKKMYHNHEGVPIELTSTPSSYISFAGQRLENDYTLNEYVVQRK